MQTVSLSSRLLAPFSCQERVWSLSAYEGVVWSPAVHHKRAMYACRECNYEGDRFYHTKKHHLRIHVFHGIAMPRKRKYHKDVPAASLQQQKLHKRANEALQAHIKIAAFTRVKTHESRLQPESKKTSRLQPDSKKTNETPEQLPQKQQILSFGEFDIKWARQHSVDKQNLSYRRASASDFPCDTIDVVENNACLFFPARIVPHDTEDWKNDSVYGNLPMFAIDHSSVEMPLPSV